MVYLHHLSMRSPLTPSSLSTNPLRLSNVTTNAAAMDGSWCSSFPLLGASPSGDAISYDWVHAHLYTFIDSSSRILERDCCLAGTDTIVARLPQLTSLCPRCAEVIPPTGGPGSGMVGAWQRAIDWIAWTRHYENALLLSEL